ncbi:inositol monophosphatase [Fulvivirga sp. RKSG066]|uniref:3'(2'),5'-bisphosphate nucleotidase CysQ family protein n=1 Tax=Fulvivirga aurantia TaxID=2529383 RepID=UPI0012BD5CBF|nr:inositol monophosphatase family protein [Fulvivirga aurantia]MTI22923.1 inositol monophosphatase [Fulvivirga aurantia]
MLNNEDLHSLCALAETAAKAAGEYIQSQFNQQHETLHKDGGSTLASQVVTEVDIKAQEIIIKHMQPSIDEFDLGLLTEESADDQSRLKKSHFWCVDPLDGTLSFTRGHSGYSVSIALVSKSGDPVIGVVYIPDVEQSYTSIKGMGVKLNGLPISRNKDSQVLNVYMDRSLAAHKNFDFIKTELKKWSKKHNLADVSFHKGFGAVRNAVSVMLAGHACYFKFPKPEEGGGSIWDFAATRLFFEELGLQISNAHDQDLHLNNPDTAFMNEQGVVYATDEQLKKFILGLYGRIHVNG